MKESEGKTTTVVFLSKKDQEKAERFTKLVFRSLLLIMWSVVMLLVGLTGGFELGSESGYNSGFKDGYHDARTTYECDHDRSECKMLKSEEL